METNQKPRERVFTRGLIVFVLLVGAVLGYAAIERLSTPGLEAAVRELADGDLDGPERPRVLRAVVEAGAASSAPRARWAGLLAAVALADRAAFDSLRELVEQPPADRRFLDLGDPMLHNLGEALWAEAAGRPAEARARWLQVQAQCRLAPRPLAAELAAAALK